MSLDTYHVVGETDADSVWRMGDPPPGREPEVRGDVPSFNAPEHRLATRVVHAGHAPDAATGAVATPIYATSSYVHERPGHTPKGFGYSRSANPTRGALEEAVSDLENGSRGFAYASGMAAAAAVLELLEADSHVIAGNDLYGGTIRLLETVRSRNAGLEHSLVDLHDEAALEAALKPNSRLLWIESPSNPQLRIHDIARLARWGRSRGLITVVDNTFATPMLQQPLELGADLVVHSATKYLNGHSDILGGLVIAGRAPHQVELAERLAYLQMAVGAVSSPFDSFLALRGVRTLALRMERHSANALSLARWLELHPAVQQVHYPGLESHPDHLLASWQMRAFGGVITIELGSEAEALAFIQRLELFTLADSLGGVESLVGHPWTMSHGSLSPERKGQLGISRALVRLSVGIEDVSDLRADLERALDISIQQAIA